MQAESCVVKARHDGREEKSFSAIAAKVMTTALRKGNVDQSNRELRRS